MTRLLIITQKVDRNDPILGFFHRWIVEFAKHGRVTVIGQRVGEHDLPGVHIESLGKERGTSRIGQVFGFWSLITRHRAEYDAVLVHMTPVWLVLGAPVWLVFRKRMYLWYEARGGGIWLRMAALLSRNIFSASPRGLPLVSSKHMIVGHGIDTAVFRPSTQPREAHRLVTVGRMTIAKRLELMIDVVESLPDNIHLQMAGLPLTDRDEDYVRHIEAIVHRKGLEKRIHHKALRQDAIVPFLQSATVFIHASATALDKALLEAMACGCPVVSCASAVQDLLPEPCQSTTETFGIKIEAMLERSVSEREALGKDLRRIVEENHGLPRLVERLVSVMA